MRIPERLDDHPDCASPANSKYCRIAGTAGAAVRHRVLMHTLPCRDGPSPSDYCASIILRESVLSRNPCWQRGGGHICCMSERGRVGFLSALVFVKRRQTAIVPPGHNG